MKGNILSLETVPVCVPGEKLGRSAVKFSAMLKCPLRLLKKLFSRTGQAFSVGAMVWVAMLATAGAQTPTPDPNSPERGTWTADLPGGTYIVMLSAITSISQHEYVVDGAARVTEVNINTLGPIIARFYFIEPNAPQMPDGIGQSGVEMLKEKTAEAMGRTGGDEAWSKVMKNYPTTTHAGTVEYRLSSLESLGKLFKSVERSWLGKKPGKFKP